MCLRGPRTHPSVVHKLDTQDPNGKLSGRAPNIAALQSTDVQYSRKVSRALRDKCFGEKLLRSNRLIQSVLQSPPPRAEPR
jgi:hypothetical protein